MGGYGSRGQAFREFRECRVRVKGSAKEFVESTPKMENQMDKTKGHNGFSGGCTCGTAPASYSQLIA